MTTWQVRLAGPAGERAVFVEGDPDAPRGHLAGALAGLGWPADTVYVDDELWRPDDTRPVGRALHHGALLGRRPNPASHLPAGTYLLAAAGPASGDFVPLHPGVAVAVGRHHDGRAAAPRPDRDPADPADDGNDGDDGDDGAMRPAGSRDAVQDAPLDQRVWLRLDDPLMSGEHCEFVLSDGVVTVRDLGSRNGTVCDGALVGRQPVALADAAVVHAGATLLRVVDFGDADRATLLGATPTGRMVQRQFREAHAEVPEPPAVPRPPATHEAEGAVGVVLRALVPVAAAGGMAVLTGRWWFIAIGILSPVVYGADALRRSRQRHSEQAGASARHAAELARHAELVERYRRAEAQRARRRHAGGGAAVLAARFGHRRVWERQPGDSDFGWVTPGHAGLPSAYQGDRSDPEAGVALWQVPLSVDLVGEGPLGITGRRERARAVARSLVADLTTAHAPTDVHVWVLADSGADGESAWAFARWLPHVCTGAGAARLATSPESRSVLVQSLRGLIETRREQRGRALPLHVVVIDGAHTLPAADLAELLGDGPAVGVVGVVVDASVVPEGVRGEVRLGTHADECSYRSVLTPRIDAVAVAELTAESARAAALALAPLDSFGAGNAPRRLGRVHLTELLGLGDRSATEQAAFWQAHSPCTDVPVGVTVDGAPLHVDIVRHGPHGLVGGMTRSGKTEFLKTWLAALALYNHPDDLAIVIVDFKGGVDHQAVAALPHVVALATNQDIDLFERTLTLLTAEQERRQRLFADVAGVATLEGYRTARTRRTELPAVPRLVVVVDEFAELLDTPEGRAQLGRLESTARIGAGLGVHLVLLTQLFDHALPPTIDAQAGLRVCFKVQHGEHSNVVLKSPAAASIGAAAKGRGFVRVQGGDLVEFQAARVGNATPRAVPTGAGLTARYAPVATLAQPIAAPDEREVPNEHQDLHRVVTLVSAAAGGWRPTLPWPGDLPARVAPGDLVSTGSTTEVDEIPIALADDPTRQRVVPLGHRLTDDVVLYAGAPGSGHHDALVATAAQIARHLGPDHVHLYGIDLVGHGLARLAALPHVGTVATRDDATALRIVHHLIAEAAARKCDRAGGARIVLLVLGLERAFLHAEGASSPLLAPLTTLINELPGTGIQVVCSGSPAMVGNRIGTAAARRLVFGAHDPIDYPPGVPRPVRARLTTPGRCFDQRTGLLAQFVDSSVVELVANPPAHADGAVSTGPTTNAAHRPRRFTRAPWPLRLADVGTPSALRSAGRGLLVPLGVRPDSGEVVWLDPAEDGAAHRLVGPPKSGRSNALAAIAVLAAACGWDVVVSSASRRSPLHGHPQLAGRIVPVGELADWVGERIVRPTVIVVDDAHRLDDDYPWRKLAAVESAPVMTFVAGSTEGLARPLGVARTLGAPGGVALMPTRGRDADTLGLRMLDEEWLVQPLPGIGVAAIAGEAHRVQFPLVLDRGR